MTTKLSLPNELSLSEFIDNSKDASKPLSESKNQSVNSVNIHESEKTIHPLLHWAY